MKSPDTFISVDIETTGLDPHLHEIIEIGAVKVESGAFVDEFKAYVKPTVSIPEFITSLTGISDNDVAGAASISDVLPEFIDFARGSHLLGQNVGFDLSFLRKHGGIGSFGPAIDNIEFARIILPQLHAYNLDSLIEFFALETEDRHRALADAQITAIVFLKLLNMLRVMPPDFASEMHQMASRTGSTIADVFEAHLKERLSLITGGPSKVTEVPPAIPVKNNIYGPAPAEQDMDEQTPAYIDSEIIAGYISDNGGLSKQLEGFEERSGQVHLCSKITKAFNDSEILVAEAGTGIGKSLAYLLPAIYWAEEARERVIISTNTKNLQEQLFQKDIPLLGKVLKFPFRAIILKGRGNYVCVNRWNRIKGSGGRYLSSREKSMLLPVSAWLNLTKTGDLSETGFFPLLAESGLFEKINSDSPTCVGGRCRYRDQCYVNRIRRAAQRSHIIIVNHSLVFSDMVSDGGVLGSYSRIVFDEAHNIEKVALRFLGVTLSAYRVRRMLNRMYTKSEGQLGLFAQLASWCEDAAITWPEFEVHKTTIDIAISSVEAFRTETGTFFDRLFTLVRVLAEQDGENHEGKLRYYEGCTVFRDADKELASFDESAVAVASAIGDIVLLISDIPASKLADREEIMTELEELKLEVKAIMDDLAFLVEAGGRNVFWFEYPQNGSSGSLRVQSAPLDIAEKLAYGLFDHMETVVLASATLTVARDFSYIKRRLGVTLDTRERVVDFIAESPFDYRRQSAVVVPSFLPSPKAPEFIDAMDELLFSVATVVGRGMLVLFTSKSHLHKSYHALKDRFTRHGITLMAQGIDGSRSLLLRRFQEDTRSVLFGTDSFWEGVDVPGNALEIVVISRLPFAVPSDPVIEALSEEVARQGGNPFIGYAVPEAAIKLRQGAGRLIRHRNDRGAVIVCDTRIATTRYGALFMKSLPGSTIRGETLELLVERLQQWFDE